MRAMFSKFFISILLILSLGAPSFAAVPASTATPTADSDDNPPPPKFAKPYEYEREANGEDPDGIEYHENQAEDLQVVFVSALPFTAAASFGLTALASLAFRGRFAVDGDYWIPFIVGTFGGAATVAGVSVLTNKYPPPGQDNSAETISPMPPLAFRVNFLTAQF